MRGRYTTYLDQETASLFYHDEVRCSCIYVCMYAFAHPQGRFRYIFAYFNVQGFFVFVTAAIMIDGHVSENNGFPVLFPCNGVYIHAVINTRRACNNVRTRVGDLGNSKTNSFQNRSVAYCS